MTIAPPEIAPLIVFAILSRPIGVGFIGTGGRAGAHIGICLKLKETDPCNIIADYAGGPSVVLMNSLSHFTGVETMLRGTDGIITFKGVDQMRKNEGVRIVPAAKGAKEIFLPWKSAGDTARLWSNFLECVQTRQRPYSPIDIAVRVQAPLNMAILAHRASKVAHWDHDKKQIVLS